MTKRWNVTSFAPQREGHHHGGFATKREALVRANHLWERYGTSLDKIEVWNRETGSTTVLRNSSQR